MGNETWNNKTELRKEWWRKKRLNYNVGLILSGILAFILYVIVVEFVVMKSEKNWEGELTIFSIIFQGIGYLIMIGIANLFYYLGSLSELIIEPENPEKYRNLTYGIGYWFSCGIPFLIPIILFIEFI
jgi:hypothetical protein